MFRVFETFRRLLGRAVPGRRPERGESVWWAPRAAGGVVTGVEPPIFHFTTGDAKHPTRFRTSALIGDAVWDSEADTWIVGQGVPPRPKRPEA